MYRGVVGVVLCVLCCGCGSDLNLGTSPEDGSLHIGGGPSLHRFGTQRGGGLSGTRPIEDTTVKGNIFKTRPPSLRPVVVFVFVDLRDPGTFQDFRDAEGALVEDDRTFQVSHLAAGSLTVVFLLDQAGANQDGTIDPGDPIAIFQDPNGRLKNLSAITEVLLADVDVSFNLEAPESGTAIVSSDANILVTQKLHQPLFPHQEPPWPSPAGPPPAQR